MSSFKDLEIYKIAFDLAFKVHNASLKLPQFELYEQGSHGKKQHRAWGTELLKYEGRKTKK